MQESQHFRPAAVLALIPVFCCHADARRWDYGYQITSMANRTVIVDNNTWNNTHIATVGRAMASNEEDAYEIMRQLDVDYVLVIFGGLSGYSSDDINKFLWMVRIGGGVYPEHIQEKNFLSEKVSLLACLCLLVTDGLMCRSIRSRLQ